MYVKFSLADSNSSPCLQHLTNTYTCKVTTVPKVHNGTVITITKFKTFIPYPYPLKLGTY